MTMCIKVRNLRKGRYKDFWRIDPYLQVSLLLLSTNANHRAMLKIRNDAILWNLQHLQIITLTICLFITLILLILIPSIVFRTLMNRKIYTSRHHSYRYNSLCDLKKKYADRVKYPYIWAMKTFLIGCYAYVNKLPGWILRPRFPRFLSIITFSKLSLRSKPGI